MDYLETFGSGMMVYWYGFVDSTAVIEPGIAVKFRKAETAWVQLSTRPGGISFLNQLNKLTSL